MEYVFITFTGEEFNPLNPDMNKIHIEDIAHSLSLMCRSNGHINTFYSVAQHSINCANEAKARGYSLSVQLACLLHDACEAYISDITRPVKQYLTEYVTIESRLQDVIFRKFLGASLSDDETICVNQIDDDMLISELYVLKKYKKNSSVTPNLMSNPVLNLIEFNEAENTFLKIYYGIMHAGLIQGRLSK